MARHSGAFPLVLGGLRSALPSLVFLGLVLAVSETWLRFEYGRIESITGATPWELDSWQGLTYFWDQYDEVLGWSNLPGYRSDERVPFRVSINAQGLRAVHEYAATPPNGVQRIALFGDSCAFGEEVDDDETVGAFLAMILRDAEVLNFGVRGYGLGQMMLRLEREGYDLEPDRAVFLVLIPSDISRDAVDHFSHNKPVFRVVDGELEIGNVPVPLDARQPWLLRHSFVTAWAVGRPKRWPQPISLESHLEISHAILDRIRRSSQARGLDARVALIVVPGILQEMRRNARERQLIDSIRKSLAKADLPVIDLVPSLEAAYQREGKVLEAPIAHWSARGNQVIAEGLARELRRD